MFQDSLLDSSGKSNIDKNPVLGISFPSLWKELRTTCTKDAWYL